MKKKNDRSRAAWIFLVHAVIAIATMVSSSMLLSVNAFVLTSYASISSSSITATTATTTTTSTALYASPITVPGMWGSGLNFGKGDFCFYRSFESFMKPFPLEDREAFPEVFSIPKGVYEVSLTKPLGIVFEEIEAGKGVFVQDLVEGGLAERQGKIQKGDVLVGVTATKVRVDIFALGVVNSTIITKRSDGYQWLF
jgi:hypothetical protein